MTTADRHPSAAFSVSGDGPAIDFVNTADWHAAATPTELLTSYDRLLDWGQAVGLLEATAAARLRAVHGPDAAAAALAEAIALREALYRTFAAVARGAHAAPADLAVLNAALPGALARLRLAEAEAAGRYRWDWQADASDPLAFLAPVIRAAAELLVSPQAAFLRECAGHPCGWIFLDHSRNHTRRWCSMAGCGNRAKARRHYARVRAAAEAQPGGGGQRERSVGL